MKLSRQNWLALVLAVALVAAVGVTATQVLRLGRPTASKPTTQSKPLEGAQPTPLDSLEIEAIRQRSYPGSAITTEQQLGSQGGYSDQIVLYRSDGLKIYALVSTPNGPAPPKGWPVVVLCHGY